MTITDTTRPPRSRKAPRHRARLRRRRPLPITRRLAKGRLRVPYADEALNAVMQEADIFKVGRRHYLVAPLSRELLDTLILAAAATEDDEAEDSEDNGDAELSLGWSHPHATNAQFGLSASPDDRESDGLDDEGGEAALGWANEGSQANLGVPMADEAEPELGWGVSGHLWLAAGYIAGDIREGDNDCDDEDDDPDHAIDDVPHDPDHDNEPSLAGISAGWVEGQRMDDREGDVYAPTDRDAGYVAEAAKRTAERPYDPRLGARKLVLAAMRRSETPAAE